MSLSIALINGPNLNLLGHREPDIYGNTPFADYLVTIREKFHEVSLPFFQSNIEGELINYLHECRHTTQGVVLNAGGYTHTSVALADAVAAIRIPVIEVHISNIFAREEYRRTSFISSKCVGSISGLGLYGYDLAVEWLLRHLSAEAL